MTSARVLPVRFRGAVPAAYQTAPSEKPAPRPPHLPAPPTDEEKYSYFAKQRRWPFVWLAAAQGCLIYAFTAVMLHTPDTALGLIFLTVMVPPVLVNLWLRLRPRRLTLQEHRTRVTVWRDDRAGRAPGELPSVDVFLPSCGEPAAVLDNAFAHVARLDWPGRLRVHVLDDAASADTERLAAHHGFDYVVRPDRGQWKKAGNMIAAFDRTDGDVIVVFDADFVPRTDFLWETLPYLDDERTGVVQTAQYFDIDRRVNYFARYSGALQEMFFRWIQPARDTCEAAICAGTNVVYRRAAVEAAGGFARVPLGEDVHSGVKIWVANYRTRYLPLVVAKGLAPDSWNAVTNQQYRWCRSSMLLMISGFFRDAPFSRRQRVCFWAAFLYYMSSAVIPLTSVLPTLIMVWFFPGSIHPLNYVLLLPSLISTLVVFPLIARGWRPAIMRICTVNSFCHAFAVLDALRNQVRAWVPTGAAGAATRKKGDVPRRVAWTLRLWLVVTQGLLWTGVARHLGTDGVNPWLLWPAILLGLYQLAMLAPMAWSLGPAGDVYDPAVEIDSAGAASDLDPQAVAA